MRKTLTRAISLLLAAVMVFTSVDLSAFAAEYDSKMNLEAENLKEELRNMVSDEEHPNGVFELAHTMITMSEGEDGTISVVRAGNTDKQASVVFKAVDVSTEYGKDYVITVDQGSLFGETELPAADGVKPLLEEYGEAATEEDLQTSKDVELPDVAADDVTDGEVVDELGAGVQDAEETIQDEVTVEDTQDRDDAGVKPADDETAEAAASDKAASDAADPDEAAFDVTADGAVKFSGGSSLANIYQAQTGEAAPEYDWTEYNEKDAPEDAVEALHSGWDESRENLQALPGVTCKLTFAPGEYKKDVTVRIKDDSRSESDEVMIFVLQDAEGAEIGDHYNGYLNITDNDDREEVSYSVKEKEITVTADQDKAVVTVVRNSGIDQMGFVTVGTQAVDAVADEDYVSTYKELFFAAGITERTVEVPIMSDREFESHFWIGIRTTGGTVLEDDSCFVTIAADPVKNGEATAPETGADHVTVLRSSMSEDVPEVVQAIDSNGAVADGADADGSEEDVDALGAGWEDCKKVVLYNNDNGGGTVTGEGKYHWLNFPEKESQHINLVNADWISYTFGIQGCYENFAGTRWWDKEFWVSVMGQSGTDKEIIQVHQTYEGPRNESFNWKTFTGRYALPADWNYPDAEIKTILASNAAWLDDNEVHADLRNITLGYNKYNFIIREGSTSGAYQEKIYTAKDKSSNGRLIDFPKVYFTDENGQPIEGDEKSYYSGETVSTARAAQGDNANSLGVYASDDTVEFKGFKVIKPNDLRHPISDDMLDANFKIDGAFKMKWKDYMYKDGTFEIVPIFEPKKVTVTFNNDNATVDGKADAMGNFEGFPAGTTQELTMLDTLDVRAKANPGHAVTAISLEKKTGDKYSNVADNMKQENAYRFATPVNFSATEYRMCTHYDESSITVAPEPTINDKAALKDIGRVMYVDHTIQDGESGNNDGETKVAEGGEEFSLKDVSINQAYTFGSTVDKGYHTIWYDGTLDKSGTGVYNDVNPSYKSFMPSVGGSMKYVTKLPFSKLYYNFVQSVPSNQSPVPIRGWLKINDRLLISGSETSYGLNGISVSSDGAEYTTENGGYDGRNGDGYFELRSDEYFKHYNYAVTFTGTSDIGDIAAMCVMNPGRNEEININVWEDVSISDVVLFQEVEIEEKDENGKNKKVYQPIDVSGTRSGYFTGLTNGDYNYRIRMTARRDGVNVDRGVLTIINKDGSAVVIDGVEDNNKSGIFTFDFNPQTEGKQIQAGAIAKVTFYSGETQFLSRDVGIKFRPSLGVITLINSVASEGSPVVKIIGAVNAAFDLGWQGNFDQVVEGGPIGIDEAGNKVIKIGFGTPLANIQTDSLKQSFDDASKKSSETGKAASKVAKLENKLSKAKNDAEKAKIKGDLAEAEKDYKEKKTASKEARDKLDENLAGDEKPVNTTPKFGHSFTLDMGVSFLMTFGYDDSKEMYYFKNLMLSAQIKGAYNATVTFATPIGVTIGIGLKLEMNAKATFMIEERTDIKNPPLVYIDTMVNDQMNLIGMNGDDAKRALDKYGIFNITPTIGLSLSAGVLGDAIKVTVSGDATFNMIFGTSQMPDSAGSCQLTASIEVSVLGLAFDIKLADKTFPLWGDQEILDADNLGAYYVDNVMRGLEGTDNSYLYESVDVFEPIDVSYMADPADWYGAGGLLEAENRPAYAGTADEVANLGAIDEGGIDAYLEMPIMSKIVRDPSFDMAPLSNGRFAAVFLNAPADRIGDPDNARAVYYMMFDGSVWSTPKMLEDDGTLDQYPRIYSMGDKGAVILWSTINKAYKDSTDKIARQNALDLHGVIVSPDGTLLNNGEIQEVTMTTSDKIGEGTDQDFSDFAADKAFGVFLSGDRLVVCYEKREYAAGNHPDTDTEDLDEGSKENVATVGDMMYAKNSIMAARVYNLATGEFEENAATPESLPGLAALGGSEAIERYNANVYGQIIGAYLPDVMITEDIARAEDLNDDKSFTQKIGYYRKDGAGTTAEALSNPAGAMLIENDAAPIVIDGKDYGVMAYTLDVDGNLETLNDQELYLMTFDFANDKFSEPIILTGYQINASTGVTYKPENSNPRFVNTSAGLYLSWLQNPDVVAINVTNLLEHESDLVKTGEISGKTYRYVDKSMDSYYEPPTSLVTNRIAEIPEGGEEQITGNIHSFSVASNGDYVYVLWPETTDEENEETAYGMTATQLWCARSEVVADPEGKELGLGNRTNAVQVTSLPDNNYSDVTFEVMSDGRLLGLGRQVPWRYISTAEAEKIYKDTFDADTFVPYPIWDDTKSIPVAFRVNPAPAARIKKADFVEADVTNGASVTFEVLNDSFNTLKGATVTAKDSKGNSLLSEYDEATGAFKTVSSLTIPDLIGGGRHLVTGSIPLDADADKAEVIITLKDGNGNTVTKTITKELESDVRLSDMAVEPTLERNKYRVTGTVTNIGSAKAASGRLSFVSDTKDAKNSLIDRLEYPELMPGDTFAIDTVIEASLSDFDQKYYRVDLTTNTSTEITTDEELTELEQQMREGPDKYGAMYTEELKLYATYENGDDFVKIPVYAFADPTDESEDAARQFIIRTAYPSEVYNVLTLKPITVKVITSETDKDGNVSGKIVSEGKEQITLEAGETVGLMTDIETYDAEEIKALTATGEEITYNYDASEGLTYRYEFIGDAAAFNDDGQLKALKTGSGKLKVYVYPADRVYSTSNGDKNDAFEMLGNGDYVDTYAEYPERAITTYTLDVDVVKAGDRLDIEDSYFTDANGIKYHIISGSEVAVSGIEDGKTIEKLVIPATVKNDADKKTYKVSRIENGAFDGNQKITSVSIGKNVTRIGDNAFRGCAELTKVTFGSGVTDIGDNAFAYCYKLTGLNLPSKLVSIGDNAFADCTSITKVVLPATLTSLGNMAFYGCKKLNSITIKSGKLTSENMGKDVFNGVAGDATYKISAGKQANAALIGALTDEHEIFSDKKGINYQIKSVSGLTVTVAGLTDAAKAKLKSLSIPAKVTYKGNKYIVVGIEDDAFVNNTNLTKVTLPKSVTAIGDRAFAGMTELKSAILGKNVIKIGEGAYSGDTKLSKVTISAAGIEIGDAAFEEVPDTAVFTIKVKDATAKKAITDALIGDKSTFDDKKGISYVIFTPQDLLGYMSDLTGLSEKEAKKYLETQMAGVTGRKTKDKNLSIPASVSYRGAQFNVTGVADKAFYNDTALEKVTFGKNVSLIMYNAFEGCTSLKTVNAKSVYWIFDEAFKGCSSLTKVTTGKNLEWVGDNAFYGCNLTKVPAVNTK